MSESSTGTKILSWWRRIQGRVLVYGLLAIAGFIVLEVSRATWMRIDGGDVQESNKRPVEIGSSQLEKAMAFLGINLTNNIKSDRMSGSMRFIETLDKCCLREDLSSNLLITYFCWDVEEVPEGLTAADSIPKSEAVTQAQDFFDALGEGVKIRESDMVKYNDSMERVPGDLFGATWLVARIEGVDTGNVQVAFKFEVSAYSGRVEAYSRNPEWVPGKQE